MHSNIYKAFVAKSFALVNNVVKSYFGVTPYAVDVLGTVDTITAIPSGLLLVVLGEYQIWRHVHYIYFYIADHVIRGILSATCFRILTSLNNDLTLNSCLVTLLY